MAADLDQNKVRHKGKDLELYRRLLAEARPYWLRIAGVFFLTLLESPLSLLSPLPLKIAVDSAIGSHPLPGSLNLILPAALQEAPAGILVLAVGLLVGISVFGSILNVVSSFARKYIAERLVLSFRARLFRHVQRLSLSYHDTKGPADSIYRIQWDTATLQYICLDGLPALVTSVFTLIAMFYVTFRIDKELALVAIAVSPVLFVLSQKYRPLFRDRSAEVKRLETSALGVLQEVLSAVRVVKAFGREEYEEGRFVRSSTAGMWARLKLDVLGGFYGLLIGLTTVTGTAAVLWIGAQHVRDGVLTLGSLLLVMSYLAQLYSPLKTIGRKAASLQGHLVGAERAFSVLDQDPDVSERPNARPLTRCAGSVTLQNVSFAYEEGHPVLHDVSLDIPAGARVGISGRTGAGKTTLLNLLMRFYDPSTGQILLDGVALCDYRLADLRSQFAIVLQEPVLFSATIAENIAYARPEATQEEIIHAAKLADAHDFILRLPDSYQTIVGERGMRLSGGERQRISLARAFLKDAPVLLLDEPTSSVDVKTEAAIMQATNRLMRGRTTFLIAHRLSTLENCDIRLELEHGRVISSTTLPREDSKKARDLDKSMFSAYTPLEHPATKAWLQLDPGQRKPTKIETLKVKAEPMLYRLTGAGPGGSDVFAKRFDSGGGTIERTIYQDLLPKLAVPSLRCFGFREGTAINGDQVASWLFMEDAGEVKYSPKLKEHQTLASRWLGALHVATANMPIPDGLPDRGPDCYLDSVRVLRERIHGSFASPYLREWCAVTLNAILSQCDIVEAHWDEIMEFCAPMPRTVVHGDLSVENIRVRDGKKLLVMDWETAGWGVPAVDFAHLKGMLCPDVTIYASVVRPIWPFVKLRDLEQLVNVGTMFRLFFTMACVSENLRYDWADQQMDYLIWLQGKTAEWIEAAGWNAGVNTLAEVGG